MPIAHHVCDLGAKVDGAVTKNFASLFTVRNQNKDTNEVDTKPVGDSNQSLMSFVDNDMLCHYCILTCDK